MAAFWLLGGMIILVGLVLLFLWHPRVGELFHKHVQDRPKRRLFLAAVGFFFTLAFARGAAYAAGRGIPPFHYIYIHGIHVHHLVWGILLLLVVGFGWLIEIGTGTKGSSLFASRLMSLLYGIVLRLPWTSLPFGSILRKRSTGRTRGARASMPSCSSAPRCSSAFGGETSLRRFPVNCFAAARRKLEKRLIYSV